MFLFDHLDTSTDLVRRRVWVREQLGYLGCQEKRWENEQNRGTTIPWEDCHFRAFDGMKMGRGNQQSQGGFHQPRITQKNCKWWAIIRGKRKFASARKTPLNIRWKWLSCALFCNEARPSVYPYIRLILHMLSMGNALAFISPNVWQRKPPTEHLYL